MVRSKRIFRDASSPYRNVGKRLFDLTSCLIFAPLLLPLMAATFVAVRLVLGSPALFMQPRPGLHGQIFRVRKFRTMTDERDGTGALLPDALRLTRFGAFLRSTSLDELPALINVVEGNMSLVGPRPLLVEYLTLYNREQMRRHDALPGITGWAQIHGRNTIDWERKFALDLWYIDNQSLMLDIRILLLTALQVVRRDGITSSGASVGMAPFNGSSPTDDLNDELERNDFDEQT